MSDLLNKYKEAHDRFIDVLVRYYPLHEGFLEKQTIRKTGDLRRALKQMRVSLKELERLAQLRLKECGAERRNKKEKIE